MGEFDLFVDLGWSAPKEQPPRESLRHQDRRDQATLESERGLGTSPPKGKTASSGQSLRFHDSAGRLNGRGDRHIWLKLLQPKIETMGT